MLVRGRVIPQQYDASPHFIHLDEERQTGLKFLVFLENTTMAGTGPRTTFVCGGGGGGEGILLSASFFN